MPPNTTNQKRIKKDFYTYGKSFGTIAVGATESENIAIETDANFIITKIAASATIAGAAQTLQTRVIPLLRLSINDTGSGRNLQNTPIPLDLLSGDGSLPFVLPIQRKFQANATINLTLTNFSAATEYADVFIALLGYKIFV